MTSNNTDREKLVEELRKTHLGFMSMPVIENIADFILADRQRIVKPLVKEVSRRDSHYQDLRNAIDETLKRAGVE